MTIQQEHSQLSDPQLLDKIDRLRDLNISQHVALPQVGHSIFYSSVLTASGLSADLCSLSSLEIKAPGNHRF
jgi:hypothetical protein